MSAPKNKKKAPAEESGNRGPKHKKQKLIHLDDLIPKEDVKGGHHLIFGANDSTQTVNDRAKQK